MKQKNLISLFFLAAAVALWGLVASERRSTKGGLAEKFIPTAFADVPGPESASAESGSGSAECAEGSVGESASAESASAEGESGSCEGSSCESGCAVGDSHL